jgi:hypothetical protein
MDFFSHKCDICKTLSPHIVIIINTVSYLSLKTSLTCLLLLHLLLRVQHSFQVFQLCCLFL